MDASRPVPPRDLGLFGGRPRLAIAKGLLLATVPSALDPSTRSILACDGGRAASTWTRLNDVARRDAPGIRGAAAKRMRRFVAVHALVFFTFDSVIPALTTDILAGLPS